MMNTKSRRWAAGLFAALVGITTAPLEAHADGPQESQQPVVLVADFSGSMNEADADEQGTTRIDAAKTAVKELLNATPEDSRLGLVAYGTNNDSCDDITTLNPVGDFDAGALSQQIDGLEAKGNTPIGPALTHAAGELEGIEGAKSIVLVSDGEPNCEPPPACDVARDLVAQGIDITMHTIGFRISGNAKAQETLRCIAEVTDGSYTDVDNATELKDALKQETIRAMAGYQSQGIEVEGGPEMTDPEELVAGQYVVKMVSGEEQPTEGSSEEVPNRRYFAVPYHEGWDVAVSATLVPPQIESGEEAQAKRAITLAEYSMSGRFCALRDHQVAYGDSDMQDLKANLLMETDQHGCMEDSGMRAFSIARSLEGWADEPLEIEFTVAYYKADSVAAVEASDPGAAPQAVEPTEPEEVQGGSSFNNATVLEPGQTISDNVNGLERRYFAIPVAYGQSMQVRLDAPDFEGAASVGVTTFNPLRQNMRLDDPSVGYDGTLKDTTGNGAVHLAAPLKNPILPGNLLSGDELTKAAAFGGMQYVVVSRAWHDTRGTTALPFTLTVDVWGDAADVDVDVISTAKDYEAEFAPPEPSPSPSPTPSETESAPESASEEPTPTPSEEPQTEPEPADGGFPWGLALGGAGVLCVGAGVAWLLLRRRTR